MKIKVMCEECKSICDIEHEMESYHYEIDHCPFCGADIDEEDMEDITDNDHED
jgi:hypothetical protein|tara:strand:- start:458 stop:616 length:159 start_codon:yes stop_codon:yes gene_type:complete